MSAEALPEWLVTPPGGWTADDLDRLPPEAPRCEVLDGALYLMSPQRSFHSRAMRRLADAIERAMPVGWQVDTEMGIKLNRRNRPEPDLVVVYPGVEANPDRTWYRPEEVALAIEIQSPESILRDRVTKPKKYASAGIPHYWLIDDVKGAPIVQVFLFDQAKKRYFEVSMERHKLEVAEPFPMTIDLQRLYP